MKPGHANYSAYYLYSFIMYCQDSPCYRREVALDTRIRPKERQWKGHTHRGVICESECGIDL